MFSTVYLKNANQRREAVCLLIVKTLFSLNLQHSSTALLQILIMVEVDCTRILDNASYQKHVLLDVHHLDGDPFTVQL